MPHTTMTPSSRPQTVLLTTVPGWHFNLRQHLDYHNIYHFPFVLGQLPIDTSYTGTRARTRHAVGT